MLLYLHHRNSKIFLHPAKSDNFKDESISEYKTVSVPQSQILAGLKTLGLVGLGQFFYVLRNKKKFEFFFRYCSVRTKKLHKMKLKIFF